MTTIAERIAKGEVTPPPIAKLLGFTTDHIETGRCRIGFEAGAQHANPMGGLHGGVLCDIADAAMGMAYASTLAEGESFTTVELKINFLRPFKAGHLTAEGFVVNGGKTLGWTECEVRDDSGRLIAKAGSTCMTLRPAAPKPELALLANGNRW
ncbi:MAG: PaaI family thioesterase [Chloroflexota bacterium]